MLENKRAPFVSNRIGDATRADERNAQQVERQREPVIFRAKRLDQVNPRAAAQLPKSPPHNRIEASSQRNGGRARAELARLGEDFRLRIADQPCLMTVRVQPIDLEAGPIFLAAPAATAFDVKDVHLRSTITRGQILGAFVSNAEAISTGAWHKRLYNAAVSARFS